MSSTLLLPSGYRPSNLHLAEDVRADYIDNDVCNYCERIKEIDPSLYVVLLHEDDVEKHCFAIMEDCRDGDQRLVYKVKQLDERVLTNLRRIMHIPLKVRVAMAEKDMAKWEAEEKEKELDRLYEHIGGPMLIDLERCGFIQRPVSYAKHNTTARRHRLDELRARGLIR